MLPLYRPYGDGVEDVFRVRGIVTERNPDGNSMADILKFHLEMLVVSVSFDSSLGANQRRYAFDDCHGVAPSSVCEAGQTWTASAVIERPPYACTVPSGHSSTSPTSEPAR